MNKKAQEEWVYRPVMMLILFLILLFLLFSSIGCDKIKNSITGQKSQIIIANSKDTTFITLLNYLRTPLKDKTISDLIVISAQKNSFNELEALTQDTLGKFYNEGCCWILYIYDEKGSSIKKIDKCGFFQEIFFNNPRSSKINITDKLKASLILKNPEKECIPNE